MVSNGCRDNYQERAHDPELLMLAQVASNGVLYWFSSPHREKDIEKCESSVKKEERMVVIGAHGIPGEPYMLELHLPLISIITKERKILSL